MTLDWVSEEHEESENFGVFDILVKRAATKENDRSRLLTKDQSLRCVVSMLPFNSCLETWGALPHTPKSRIKPSISPPCQKWQDAKKVDDGCIKEGKIIKVHFNGKHS